MLKFVITKKMFGNNYVDLCHNLSYFLLIFLINQSYYKDNTSREVNKSSLKKILLIISANKWTELKENLKIVCLNIDNPNLLIVNTFYFIYKNILS